MKTSGFRCETKFGLLVFLGHPSGDGLTTSLTPVRSVPWASDEGSKIPRDRSPPASKGLASCSPNMLESIPSEKEPTNCATSSKTH